MVVTTIGHDPASDRSLILYAAKTPGEFQSGFEAPSQYFVVMLVCDGRLISDRDIAELSRRLIGAGCVYLCCWGQDCERVHDLFDTEWIDNGFDAECGDTIMTTWHTDDSLDDFIEYAVSFTEPTRKYQKQCNSVVAIVIDDAQALSRINEVFRAPAAFHSARELDA